MLAVDHALDVLLDEVINALSEGQVLSIPPNACKRMCKSNTWYRQTAVRTRGGVGWSGLGREWGGERAYMLSMAKIVPGAITVSW